MSHTSQHQEILAGARVRITYHMKVLRWSTAMLAQKARVSHKKLQMLLDTPIDQLEADWQLLHRLVQFSKTSACPWGYLTTRLLRWSRDFQEHYS